MQQPLLLEPWQHDDVHVVRRDLRRPACDSVFVVSLFDHSSDYAPWSDSVTSADKWLFPPILVEEHRIYPAAIQMVLDGDWSVQGRRFVRGASGPPPRR